MDPVAPLIIEIAVPPTKASFRFWRVMLAVGIIFPCVCLVGGLIAALRGTPWGITLLIIIALVVIGSFVALVRFTKRKRLAELITRLPPAGADRAALETAIKDAFKTSDTATELSTVARELAKRGFTNIVIFGRPESVPPLGPPLDVPFEPTALRDVDQRMVSLLDESGTHGDAPAASATAQVRIAWEARQKTFRGRLNHLGRLLMAYLFYAWFALSTLRSFWTGGSQTMIVIYGCAIIGTPLLMWIIRELVVRDTTFVASAAVIRRRARRWSTSCDVRVFPRTNGVLIAFPIAMPQRQHSTAWQHIWHIAVADSSESLVDMAYLPSIEFLIRAWLSPLPPPDATRLGDFE